MSSFLLRQADRLGLPRVVVTHSTGEIRMASNSERASWAESILVGKQENKLPDRSREVSLWIRAILKGEWISGAHIHPWRASHSLLEILLEIDRSQLTPRVQENLRRLPGQVLLPVSLVRIIWKLT